MRQGLPYVVLATLELLCKPGYPQLNSDPPISVPSAGIKVVNHHFQLILLFLMYVLVIKLCPFICTVERSELSLQDSHVICTVAFLE